MNHAKIPTYSIRGRNCVLQNETLQLQGRINLWLDWSYFESASYAYCFQWMTCYYYQKVLTTFKQSESASTIHSNYGVKAFYSVNCIETYEGHNTLVIFGIGLQSRSNFTVSHTVYELSDKI